MSIAIETSFNKVRQPHICFKGVETVEAQISQGIDILTCIVEVQTHCHCIWIMGHSEVINIDAMLCVER